MEERHLGATNAEGPCAACGRTIHISEFEVGHSISLAMEGLDTFDNMRPVCRSCNSAMGTMSIDEYREMSSGPATEEPETSTPQASVDFEFAHTGPVPPAFKIESQPALDILEPECVLRGLSITTEPFHEGDTGPCADCGQKFCRKHSRQVN